MTACVTHIPEERYLTPNQVGWEWSTLSECCELILGQSPPGDTYNENGIGLPFFQGKAEFGALYPSPRKWCSAPTKIAERDDVLISVRAPVGPTNLSPSTCCIGRGLAAVRPLGGMESRFVLYWLRASADSLASLATGSTFSAISGETLRAHPIPLPPLPEQRRIVAEIETQFTRLDAAVAALKRAQANLKRFRAANLASALDGPWQRVPLGEVSSIQGGIQKQPKRAPRTNAYPFLRVANVLRGRLDLDEIHRVELFPGELEKLRLQAGDLLVVEGNGSPSEIGRMAVWDGSIPDCVHQNHIIRVRLGDGLMPRFVEAYWNSPVGHRNVQGVASSTSGLYTLSVRKIAALSIPVPSLDEQVRIVQDLDRRMSVASGIESAISSDLKRAERLRQSVLRKAFAGQLVPQDPTDEPASVLLERIRSEWARTGPTPRSPQKRQRPAQPLLL